VSIFQHFRPWRDDDDVDDDVDKEEDEEAEEAEEEEEAEEMSGKGSTEKETGSDNTNCKALGGTGNASLMRTLSSGQ
tara:strand:+ start:308 stop:538 length:231 start_codon:yes stop_codon:yes gene_type:complete